MEGARYGGSWSMEGAGQWERHGGGRSMEGAGHGGGRSMEGARYAGGRSMRMSWKGQYHITMLAPHSLQDDRGVKLSRPVVKIASAICHIQRQRAS